MAFSSTAKQRLWLGCLGYDSDSVDSIQAQALFDSARTSGLYGQPANANQNRLAKALGIDISGERSCYDAAGKLYHVLLLRAWAYSVFRNLTGSKATTHVG